MTLLVVVIGIHVSQLVHDAVDSAGSSTHQASVRGRGGSALSSQRTSFPRLSLSAAGPPAGSASSTGAARGLAERRRNLQARG